MAEQSVVITPSPPPRVTGNPATDIVALVQWAWDFYNSQRLTNANISGAANFDPDDFDPGSLPDPASSNVAQAQTTANQAYTLAAANAGDVNTAEAAIDALEAINATRVVGQLTVNETDTTATHSFATAQTDTNYYVQCTCIGVTGSPTVDAVVITDITKATGSFTITVNAAPGAGNTTIFDFLVYRS